jgi:hypothetical protein
MIKINTSRIIYGSYLDEKYFFTWAQEIPCVESIEGGYLHIKSQNLSEPDLRDLIAIMYRYKLPMQQLQQFCNEENKKWFKNKGAYWYGEVFNDA